MAGSTMPRHTPQYFRRQFVVNDFVAVKVVVAVVEGCKCRVSPPGAPMMDVWDNTRGPHGRPSPSNCRRRNLVNCGRPGARRDALHGRSPLGGSFRHCWLWGTHL